MAGKLWRKLTLPAAFWVTYASRDSRTMTLRERLKRAVIFWLARRLPTCKELAPRMSATLDQTLSLRERIELKLHLMICEWCARYQQQLHLLREASRHYSAPPEDGPPAASPALSAEARERLKRALSRQDQ
jgi:hypothetical protein